MLALTPISPFRPRRWRGAILPDKARGHLPRARPGKRPVAAVADQKEVRDIKEVRIAIARERELTLLFDPGSSLEERIFAEHSRSESSSGGDFHGYSRLQNRSRCYRRLLCPGDRAAPR